MENDQLQIFNNEEFGQIRTITENGDTWFLGKDIAGTLAYKDTSDALKKHVDEEDKMGRQIADSLGRQQNTIFINESGMYSLIFKSKQPKAKEFKRWVTSEVLPSIRKTGGYVAPSIASKDTYILDLAKSMQLTNQVVQGILTSVTKMEEFVKDSLNAKDIQIDRASELIGLRSKNTMMLSGALKEKLEDLTGAYVSATSELYKKIKKLVFKEFHVFKWEEIAIGKYNRVYAFIDSIEEI